MRTTFEPATRREIEDAAQGIALADHPVEATERVLVVGRIAHPSSGGGFEREARATDPYDSGRGELRFTNAETVDLGSVGWIEIHQNPSAALIGDPTVKG